MRNLYLRQDLDHHFKHSLGTKCMYNTCNNTTLITKKHVKNYQNQLFFVPNLGVKATKNRDVQS